VRELRGRDVQTVRGLCRLLSLRRWQLRYRRRLDVLVVPRWDVFLFRWFVGLHELRGGHLRGQVNEVLKLFVAHLRHFLPRWGRVCCQPRVGPLHGLSRWEIRVYQRGYRVRRVRCWVLRLGELVQLHALCGGLVP
jgi:hypothetical protein